MRQRVITNIITLLFITAFLVPRVVDLHVFSHISEDDEPISCEICDTISVSNQFDLIIGDTFHFENDLQNIPSSFIVVTQYNTPIHKIASPVFIYNKPPPTS